MEKEIREKKSHGSVIAIVILIVLLLATVGYIVYDKVVVGDKTVESSSTDVAKKQDSVKENNVNLKIDDANVVALFNYSHFKGIGIDEKVYGQDSYSVSQMDDNYKFNLASNIFDSKVTNYTPNVLEVSENHVKDAYEMIFGPNTYKNVDKFNVGCGDYIYDSANKKYVDSSVGCGGTSIVSMIEYISNAVKYSDRIEITSKVGFYNGDDSSIYSDMSLKNNVKKIDEELVNTVSNSYDDKLEEYAKTVEDKLQEYKYTYKLNDDGFYYYTGVKRTKE